MKKNYRALHSLTGLLILFLSFYAYLDGESRVTSGYITTILVGLFILLPPYIMDIIFKKRPNDIHWFRKKLPIVTSFVVYLHIVTTVVMALILIIALIVAGFIQIAFDDITFWAL